MINCPEEPIAHVSEDGRIHTLHDHLLGTAGLASNFAAEFGCRGWGYLAGLWHDLGKYSPEFQRYIVSSSGLDAHMESSTGKVDHSTAGSIHSVKRFKERGRILAYAISGHHTGLPDWQTETAGMTSLAHRLEKKECYKPALMDNIPEYILGLPLPPERPKAGSDLSLSLWIRMLFSCLVDADFLDTESFFEPGKSKSRGKYPALKDLIPVFDEYMASKMKQASETNINRARKEVLAQCRASAKKQPGFFTLTVPTGGGKTLSSMAFALNHAVAHGKKRIIYVIPYTSIIEQTADQFRTIFGDAVIEHHSNFDAGDENKENAHVRLACENWDATVIVTTTVQFFESLFASRTSRCRKLHNIANSVVILDEAQLLPSDFLKPVLEILIELKQNYGVTLVFSTATQPALGPHKAVDFDFKGLSGMTEIMDDPQALHRSLKRINVKVLDNLKKTESWEDIAARLKRHESVLCIVNRRGDARTLWELMPKGTYHLSALMCGAHRSAQIAEIKEDIKNGKPTKVISTQLIEAGVDLDFPAVYRAIAGLDSIAQAGGRCNREGLHQTGDIFIFMPPSRIPPGYLRQASEIGSRLLKENIEDPLAPKCFEDFFREFYWIRADRLDSMGIIDCLKNDIQLRVSFREAAKKFKIIDENLYAPVIVRYRNSEVLDLLEHKHPERWLLRRLQRYTVNIPRHLHNQLAVSGAIREVHPGMFVQGHGALYHEELGFCPDKSIIYGPDELMC